jgi:hypothetical protein
MTLDADANPSVADVKWSLNDTEHDTSAWKAVINKFDQFARF